MIEEIESAWKEYEQETKPVTYVSQYSDKEEFWESFILGSLLFLLFPIWLPGLVTMKVYRSLLK